MRLLTWIFSLLVLATGPAHAENNKIQTGPVPSWAIPSQLMPVPENASGLAFIRRQDALVHLNEQGTEQYIGYRIKILHPNALQLGGVDKLAGASGPAIRV